MYRHTLKHSFKTTNVHLPECLNERREGEGGGGGLRGRKRARQGKVNARFSSSSSTTALKWWTNTLTHLHTAFLKYIRLRGVKVKQVRYNDTPPFDSILGVRVHSFIHSFGCGGLWLSSYTKVGRSSSSSSSFSSQFLPNGFAVD